MQEVYLDYKAYLEVEWKNDADAEQGDNADEDEQIFLEPGEIMKREFLNQLRLKYLYSHIPYT